MLFTINEIVFLEAFIFNSIVDSPLVQKLIEGTSIVFPSHTTFDVDLI